MTIRARCGPPARGTPSCAGTTAGARHRRRRAPSPWRSSPTSTRRSCATSWPSPCSPGSAHRAVVCELRLLHDVLIPAGEVLRLRGENRGPGHRGERLARHELTAAPLLGPRSSSSRRPRRRALRTSAAALEADPLAGFIGAGSHDGPAAAAGCRSLDRQNFRAGQALPLERTRKRRRCPCGVPRSHRSRCHARAGGVPAPRHERDRRSNSAGRRRRAPCSSRRAQAGWGPCRGCAAYAGAASQSWPSACSEPWSWIELS